ncbi:kinase-like protein [Armillaria solidipes]|uniref:non-specific serine/threonine protein kinase n=1 Tax=Armillaria solidipes TaxID=1076256 RepID=A0A2H3AX10_9AGAR|nr:kinase-like protein [Armillaria solidipes]
MPLHGAREGNVLNQRYALRRRSGAGFGTRSTIWLSKDLLYKLETMRFPKSLAQTRRMPEKTQLEVDFLQKVGQAWGSTEQQRVIRILDYFALDSSFGTHSCLVLEVLGMSLEELTRRTLLNKFPIPMCKRIIKEVLLGLDFLHRECSIVHTDKNHHIFHSPEANSADLKSDNFLLRVEDTKGVPLLGDSESSINLSCVFLGPSAVVLSDLGVASRIEYLFDGVIQPYALRAPEVYLGIPYGPSADIWNLCCFAFELVTYCRLFYPEATSQWSRDDDILGLMVSVNGLTSFPVDVLARGSSKGVPGLRTGTHRW